MDCNIHGMIFAVAKYVSNFYNILNLTNLVIAKS